MNWFRQNPFLAAYIVVLLLGIGVLSYMVSTQSQTLADTSMQFDEKVKQLQSFQNSKPFPSQENLEAIKKTLEDYGHQIQSLNTSLSEMELPVPEITPEAFQDRLREVVSEVEKRAGEVGTTLPKDFYMGFDVYKSQLPTPKNAGPLSQQLQAISIVVNRLLELKVEEILSLSRQQLPGESSPSSSGSTPPIVEKLPFEVEFLADQAKTRLALNAIATSPQAFFVIRSLSIKNSNPSGPLRNTLGAPAPQTPTYSQEEGEDHRTQEDSRLAIIVGRETLTTTVQMELLNFNIPEVKF